MHLAVDPAGGGYAHHALDALGFLDDLAHGGRGVDDAALRRHGGLVHLRHIFIEHFENVLRGDRSGIRRHAVLRKLRVQLGETVGILFRDRLFLFEGRLNVGDRHNEVRLVDIHRVNEEFHVAVVCELFRLPIVGHGTGVKAGCAGMVLVATQGHARQFDRLRVDELHAGIAFGKRIGAQLPRILLRELARKGFGVIVYSHWSSSFLF